jgi:hypothetical protein
LRLVEDAAPGALLLAPESRGPTWDVLLGAYGPDVAFLDAALRGRVRAPPRGRAPRRAGGLLDGASYALSLALGNGDLFTHALAFSPGFAAPPDPSAGRACSSRTAFPTRCCRSDRAAGAWCRACAPRATRCATASSPAATTCRRTRAEAVAMLAEG